VKQVHGTHVIPAPTDHAVEADGIWTEDHHVAISVRTADCLPILLCDPKSGMAMAIHAGWRGLFAGILTEAFKHLATLGIDHSKVQVAVGPAIGLDAFEVGPEVVGAMQSKTLGLSEAEHRSCLKAGRADRSHIDLQRAAMFALLGLGIQPKHLSIIRSCTFHEASLWHSYRREKTLTALNWSWLALP